MKLQLVNDLRETKVNEIKDLLSDPSGRLFIWGKGVYARVLAGYLRDKGITKEPVWVVDDAYYKGTEGDDTISLSRLLEICGDKDAVVYGIYDYAAFRTMKERYSGSLKHFYDLHFVVVNDRIVDWNRDYVEAHLSLYQKTYELLGDELSRITMRSYINAAVAGSFDELYDECHEDAAYFNELTEGTKAGTLIDCGAYDGDSIHDFISVFPGYDSIVAFEPDKKNVAKIHEREKREGIKNLTVYDKGVYSETMTLFFEEEGKSSSHLSESGTSRIDVMKIDDLDLPAGKNLFIKMDIEGSELNALKGAAETIKKYHPCLSICVYHKQEDLIEIPPFIDSLVGDGVYEYYLRYHGTDLAELVFYAIPGGKR